MDAAKATQAAQLVWSRGQVQHPLGLGGALGDGGANGNGGVRGGEVDDGGAMGGGGDGASSICTATVGVDTLSTVTPSPSDRAAVLVVLS